MIKPGQLRTALVEALPELGRDPDKLSLFIEGGNLVARAALPGTLPSFEYRYRLNVFLMDMTTATDAVMVPLLVWVARNQPDLLVNFEKGNAAFAFDAAFIDQQKVDLSIALDLTEAVTCAVRPDGGYDVLHWAEPDTAALLDPPLDDAPVPAPALTEIWIGDEPQALVPSP